MMLASEYDTNVMYSESEEVDEVPAQPKLADIYDINTGKKRKTPPKKYKKTNNQYVHPLKTYEEVQNVRNFYLNKTQVDSGWNTKYRDYAIFTVGCSTGLRISDILSLKYKYLVDRKGEYREGFVICERKRRKDRKIKWTEGIRNTLNIYFEHTGINLKNVKPDDYIFQSRQKNKDGSYKLSETNFSHRLKEDLEKCIELGLIEDLNYNTHTMRKSFAWLLYVKSGYNIGLVSKALCHENVDVTMRYLGLTDKTVDEALEMIQFE